MKKILHFLFVWFKRVVRWIIKPLINLGMSQTRACALLAAVVLLGAGGVAVVTKISRVESKTTDLGLKNIGKFATQAAYFTNVQIIENAQKVLGIQLPFTETKAVFSYDGIIKAGLDFAEVTVQEDKEAKTLRIHLPEIKILSFEIKEDGLKIYHQALNIFSPVTLEDFKGGMTELRAEATQKSIDNGLFENARANAEVLLKGFLSGAFDMAQYQVVFE